jgi:hypothetical protein
MSTLIDLIADGLKLTLISRGHLHRAGFHLQSGLGPRPPQAGHLGRYRGGHRDVIAHLSGRQPGWQRDFILAAAAAVAPSRLSRSPTVSSWYGAGGSAHSQNCVAPSAAPFVPQHLDGEGPQ